MSYLSLELGTCDDGSEWDIKIHPLNTVEDCGTVSLVIPFRPGVIYALFWGACLLQLSLEIGTCDDGSERDIIFFKYWRRL